jgi:hypothetical protein
MGGSVAGSGASRPHLIRTVDGGNTWQQALFPPKADGALHDLCFLDADRGWMILWNRNVTSLLRSNDGGLTWTVLSNWSPPGKRSFLYRVRFLSEQVGLLLLTKTGEGTASIASHEGFVACVTLDGGLTWTPHDLPGRVQTCEDVGNEVWCTSGMDLLKIRVQP